MVKLVIVYKHINYSDIYKVLRFRYRRKNEKRKITIETSKSEKRRNNICRYFRKKQTPVVSG
jgi:hypothetical protein